MSDGDPAVLEPRGKSNAARKGRYDGSYTGTEQRLKDKLMRQFMKSGEGPGGNSEAYRNASCWCECGRLRADGFPDCVKCARARADEIGLGVAEVAFYWRVTPEQARAVFDAD